MFNFFFLFLFSFFVTFFMYAVPLFFSFKDFNSFKLSSYECGFDSVSVNFYGFNIVFFSIVLIFVIFELEVIIFFVLICSDFYGIFSFFIFFLYVVFSFYFELCFGKLVWFF
uniref:NADH-ubiquinone oxidoreductase chain 3 n=1 Tax=Litomosoides sigmodontis TaxID=42156 RepID=A0A347YCB3_LITSI|nr:NADH dehydrogenase subunit 3 [Litomosoides sigmodontis]